MKVENLEQIAKKLGKQERAWEKPAPAVSFLKKLVKVKKSKKS
ncbi:MAG TPA: hypothetical protein PLV37_00175 [Bacillota bacterium]|nr:hypothetical protein [Bacillota bacterium]